MEIPDIKWLLKLLEVTIWKPQQAQKSGRVSIIMFNNILIDILQQE